MAARSDRKRNARASSYGIFDRWLLELLEVQKNLVLTVFSRKMIYETSKVPLVSTDATQYSKALETRMAVECTDTVFAGYRRRQRNVCLHLFTRALSGKYKRNTGNK